MQTCPFEEVRITDRNGNLSWKRILRFDTVERCEYFMKTATNDEIIDAINNKNINGYYNELRRKESIQWLCQRLRGIVYIPPGATFPINLDVLTQILDYTTLSYQYLGYNSFHDVFNYFKQLLRELVLINPEAIYSVQIQAIFEMCFVINHLPALHAILQYFDVNSYDIYCNYCPNQSLIYNLSYYGHANYIDIVKLCIDYGADLSMPYKIGDSRSIESFMRERMGDRFHPVLEYSMTRHEKIVDTLVDAGILRHIAEIVADA